MLGAIRPDEINLPLFLHVLGAMALIGSLLLVVVSLLVAWRRPEDEDRAVLHRLGLRTLFFFVLPSYLVMRIGAQWAESAEELTKSEEEAAWVGIGYITADIGALLLLVSLILAGIAMKRRRGTGLQRAVAVIAALLLVAYLVAVWAMTTKVGA